MNILKTVAIAAVGLVAFAACQQAAQNTAADEDEIKAGSRAWSTAYNAGDADGVTALYTEDAVVMPPLAPTAVGRDAIHAYIASDSAASKAAGITLNINDDDSVGVSGDMGWHSGSYSVNDASGAAIDTGMYLEIVQKKDGKWFMSRDIWNSNQAPAAAAEPAAEAPAS